jgi:hypothetical protein
MSAIMNRNRLQKTKKAGIGREDAKDKRRKHSDEYETIGEEEPFLSDPLPKRSGLISTSSPVPDLDRDSAEDLMDCETFPNLSRSNLQSSVITPFIERHPTTDFETSSEDHMKRKKIETKKD